MGLKEQIREALCDVDYPVAKEELVTDLERRGAADEVLRAVRALPLGDYDNDDEVVRSVRLDPAPERSASVRARQAPRARQQHSHLAEHEIDER